MLRKTLRKSISFIFTPFVVLDLFRFTRAHKDRKRFSLRVRDLHPCVFDKTIGTNFDRHYVYHTAWAARVVKEIAPPKHVDISSSLYFSGILSAFIPVDFYDYRPADLRLDGLNSKKGDLMRLPFDDGSVASLSCMHTVEHVGLGRYGEAIDPEGDIKACVELSRVLATGGSLLFVVPLGGEAHIEFNAHRIYTYEQVLKLFPSLTLKEFAFIPEYTTEGGLIRDADPAVAKGEQYACGCFWFVKSVN